MIIIASLFILSTSLQQQPIPNLLTPKITTVTTTGNTITSKIIMTNNNNDNEKYIKNDKAVHNNINIQSPTQPPPTTTANRIIPQMNIPFTMQYHQPPINSNNNEDNNNRIDNDDDYYSTNPTVFGDILRGTSPARILDETNDLLAFVDRTPQSTTLHALIIPKRYIPTIHELQLPSSSSDNNNNNNPSITSDLQLLYDMEQLGQTLVQRYQCSNPKDHRMVFHIPPYNTVDHLHLHVLCNHDLSIFGRTVKYVHGTPWCISLSTLIQQQLSKPVPSLSVEGLRMTPGINHFESEVAILPRAPSKNIIQLVLPCLYDDRPFVSYGEAKKYCFIKDTICYVYNDRMDPKPLYQIALQRDSTNTINSKIIFSVVMEDRYHPNRYSTTISPQPNTNLSRPEMKTVLLFQTTTKTNNTPQLLYQFTFDTSVVEDSTVADRFLSIVQSIISLPPSKNECLGEK